MHFIEDRIIKYCVSRICIYWKLKISHYRVVYRMEKNTIKVLVLKVGMRRDKEVYSEMLLRMQKL